MFFLYHEFEQVKYRQDHVQRNVNHVFISGVVLDYIATGVNLTCVSVGIKFSN